MKRLAVIFPGVEYDTGMPLFYYVKKLLKQREMEIIDISYGKLPEADKNKMYDYAMISANAAVNKISFELYDEIFFVSKSLGTAVAGSIQKNLPRKVHNIFFTPVNESIMFLCEDSVVFTGSEDPMIHISEVAKRHEEIGFELHVAKGADHSLETGDIWKDIAMLKKVQEICDVYIEDKM